jgi:hypothetical protein
MLDDHLGKKEFTDAFRLVIKQITDLKKSNEQEWTLIHSALQMLETKLREQTAGELETVRSEAGSTIKAHLSLIDQKLKEVDAKLATIRDGEDADPQLVADIVLSQIKLPDVKEQIVDTPQDVLNKLLVLPEKERLGIDDIPGLRALLDELKTSNTGSTKAGWGAHPLTIAGAGTTKSKTTRHINFTGSGVSSVVRNPDGTVDVTINGGGGASFETPVGTVDDANVTFTVSNDPIYIVVNGAQYFSGAGYSYAGGTITLDNPVGTGGFIRSAY